MNFNLILNILIYTILFVLLIVFVFYISLKLISYKFNKSRTRFYNLFENNSESDGLYSSSIPNVISIFTGFNMFLGLILIAFRIVNLIYLNDINNQFIILSLSLYIAIFLIVLLFLILLINKFKVFNIKILLHTINKNKISSLNNSFYFKFAFYILFHSGLFIILFFIVFKLFELLFIANLSKFSIRIYLLDCLFFYFDILYLLFLNLDVSKLLNNNNLYSGLKHITQELLRIKIPGLQNNILKIYVIGVINNNSNLFKNTNLSYLKLNQRINTLILDYKNITFYNQTYRTLSNPSSKDSYEKYFDILKRNNVHLGILSEQNKSFSNSESSLKDLYFYNKQTNIYTVYNEKLLSIEETDKAVFETWKNTVKDNPQLLVSTNTAPIYFIGDLLKFNDSYFNLNPKAFKLKLNENNTLFRTNINSDLRKLVFENLESALLKHPIGILIENNLVHVIVQTNSLVPFTQKICETLNSIENYDNKSCLNSKFLVSISDILPQSIPLIKSTNKLELSDNAFRLYDFKARKFCPNVSFRYMTLHKIDFGKLFEENDSDSSTNKFLSLVMPKNSLTDYFDSRRINSIYENELVQRSDNMLDFDRNHLPTAITRNLFNPESETVLALDTIRKNKELGLKIPSKFKNDDISYNLALSKLEGMKNWKDKYDKIT